MKVIVDTPVANGANIGTVLPAPVEGAMPNYVG